MGLLGSFGSEFVKTEEVLGVVSKDNLFAKHIVINLSRPLYLHTKNLFIIWFLELINYPSDHVKKG